VIKIRILIVGQCIIYQATWLDGFNYTDFGRPIVVDMNNQTVILKRFKNPQYTKKYFLNEVNSLNICIFLFNVCKYFNFNLEIYS
jgi:hypothetical protein